MEFIKFSSKAGSFNFTETAKINESNEGLLFFDKAELDRVCNDPSLGPNQSVEESLLHLALCHSVVIDKRTGKMNSASPDELALVDGAAI